MVIHSMTFRAITLIRKGKENETVVPLVWLNKIEEVIKPMSHAKYGVIRLCHVIPSLKKLTTTSTSNM